MIFALSPLKNNGSVRFKFSQVGKYSPVFRCSIIWEFDFSHLFRKSVNQFSTPRIFTGFSRRIYIIMKFTKNIRHQLVCADNGFNLYIRNKRFTVWLSNLAKNSIIFPLKDKFFLATNQGIAQLAPIIQRIYY